MRERKKERTRQEASLASAVTEFGELLAGHPFRPGTPGTPPEAVAD
ncbi:hypothetical protein OG393_16460 [Streptomyces sp. NBC_01216]|nr:hypothetical protein OG393_16460 [Streptomyces sp. NBC_01216]